MLQAYEATPEPTVLLAGGDSEPIRLLAIVLEGFGYVPLDCHGPDEARSHLDANLPCAALVYLGLPAGDAICDLIREHDGLPLLVLVDSDEAEPQERCEALGAAHWEWVDAPAERILRRLRSLINGTVR